MAMREERGEIDNHLVAGCNDPDRPWRRCGLAVSPTAIAGMLVLVIQRAFGVDLQRACHIVILSTLLQHDDLDHLQLSRLGDLPGTGDRLPSGRAGAA
jgi:hypothetical protein